MGARRHRFPTHHSDDLSAVLRRPPDPPIGSAQPMARNIVRQAKLARVATSGSGDARTRQRPPRRSPRRAPLVASWSAGTASDRAMGRGADVDSERIADDELTALALAADPDQPVDPDVVPIPPAGEASGLLPEWYVRAPMSSGGGSIRQWLVDGIVVILVAINLRRAVRHLRFPRDHLVARTAHAGRLHRGHADLSGLRLPRRRRSVWRFGAGRGRADDD